jgi:hypothetical protein
MFIGGSIKLLFRVFRVVNTLLDLFVQTMNSKTVDDWVVYDVPWLSISGNYKLQCPAHPTVVAPFPQSMNDLILICVSVFIIKADSKGGLVNNIEVGIVFRV